MSLTPENSSAGWPRFGEHFKCRRDSTHRWMKEGAQVSCDVEEPVLALAELLRDEVDRFDVRELVDVHGQAA
jgi:hypothetical protein